jgi:hypothetical protein
MIPESHELLECDTLCIEFRSVERVGSGILLTGQLQLRQEVRELVSHRGGRSAQALPEFVLKNAPGSRNISGMMQNLRVTQRESFPFIGVESSSVRMLAVTSASFWRGKVFSIGTN